MFVNGACLAEDFTDCVPQYRSGYKAHNRKVGSWENELVNGLVRGPDDLEIFKADRAGSAAASMRACATWASSR